MNFEEFEQEYISIRKKEGRLYSDDVVQKLPFAEGKEWRIRANSASKLAKQLKKERCSSFVEIGCGNGWLTNYLQRVLNVPAFGIDVNKTELEQAKRLFGSRSTFIYGDIFSMKELPAGTIIFAASIQYFPDLHEVIDSLKGTVHIVDTPFYEDGSEARKRSENYFDSKDSNMKKFYFHHEYRSLEKYNYQVLYKPSVIGKLLGGSPFPWIKIHQRI